MSTSRMESVFAPSPSVFKDIPVPPSSVVDTQHELLPTTHSEPPKARIYKQKTPSLEYDRQFTDRREKTIDTTTKVIAEVIQKAQAEQGDVFKELHVKSGYFQNLKQKHVSAVGVGNTIFGGPSSHLQRLQREERIFENKSKSRKQWGGLNMKVIEFAAKLRAKRDNTLSEQIIERPLEPPPKKSPGVIQKSLAATYNFLGGTNYVFSSPNEIHEFRQIHSKPKPRDDNTIGRFKTLAKKTIVQNRTVNNLRRISTSDRRNAPRLSSLVMFGGNKPLPTTSSESGSENFRQRRKTWTTQAGRFCIRFGYPGEAKDLFRSAVRKVMIVLSWMSYLNKGSNLENELKSFMDLAREVDTSAVMQDIEQRTGLSFNPKEYCAKREVSVTQEVQRILTLPSRYRTDEMVHKVTTGLQALRSFSEYPLHMQEKLAKVAWYQELEEGRLVLREGHFAENFYFILAGQAYVKKILKGGGSGGMQMTALGRLTKGQSFGELALLHHSKRTASVESETDMKLLVVSREDFLDIFFNMKDGEEPEHIRFCRTVKWLTGWPIDLVHQYPGTLMFHFFRRGVVVVGDSLKNDWIYIVKSGMCTVLKRLAPVNATRRSRRVSVSLPSALPRLGTADPAPRVDTGYRRRSPIRTATPIQRVMTAFFTTQKEGAHMTETPPASPIKKVSFGDQDETSNGSIDTREVRVDVELESSSEWGDTDDKVATETNESRATRHLLPAITKSTIRPDQMHPEIALVEKKDTQGPGFSRSRTNFLPQLAQAHIRAVSTPEINALKPGKTFDKSTDNINLVDPAIPCFVRLKKLTTGDAFGLQEVEFENEPMEKSGLSVCLVSNGAELIMLSRRFFENHADEHVQRVIRESVQLYPDEDIVQENLQTHANWQLFRNDIVENVLVQTPRSQSNKRFANSKLNL